MITIDLDDAEHVPTAELSGNEAALNHQVLDWEDLLQGDLERYSQNGKDIDCVDCD